MNDQEAVRQFLGDRPESHQLREWRATLEERLHSLERERKGGGAGAAALDTKIRQLKTQIAALLEEEAVTQFVEESVRVTLAMGAVAEGVDETQE